ncbi:hypothetical protein JW916_16170 [Candidatus Sumerlaeota bacterium]|nr:hypothetical protein [Candidatus Sumerlaeota bacterium]
MTDILDQLSLGEATRILRFRPASEAKFHNQVKYLRTAIAEQVYPNLKIVSLERSDPSASFDYLIVITGGKSEFERRMPPHVQEDIFKRVHPGRDWEIMWADGTVANAPNPGCSLASRDPFDEVLHEITAGLYVVNEVLSREGQAARLDAMEKEARPDCQCARCKKTISEQEMVFAYKCSKCNQIFCHSCGFIGSVAACPFCERGEENKQPWSQIEQSSSPMKDEGRIDELYRNLLAIVAGDRQKAERVIEHERQCRRSASREELIEIAIFHWEQDNR